MITILSSKEYNVTKRKNNIIIPKHQRIGLFVLAALLCMVICLKVYIKCCYEPHSQITKAQVKEIKSRYSQKKPIKINKAKEKADLTGVSINVNTAPLDSLMMIGIPKYPAQNIIKYRNKGGKLYSSKNLLKIYGMDQSILDRVSPYLYWKPYHKPTKKKYKKPTRTYTSPASPDNATTAVPDSSYKHNKKYTQRTTQKSKAKKTSTYVPTIVDINTADTSQLKKLRGIGSYLARNIVRYREKLGGYHTVKQIAEIRHMRAETYESILPFLSVSDTWKRIHINSLSADQLSRHPYISRKIARVIINYRNNNGKYQSIEDLAKIRVISQERLQKLKPYISYD